MSESDFALLKKGIQKGFNSAYRLYADQVYSLCLHIVGDEDVSSTLLQATFDTLLKQHTRLDTANTFAFWLRECAINLCSDYIHQQNRPKKSFIFQANSNHTVKTFPFPIHAMATTESVETCDYSAIATSLVMTESKSLHHRALRQVRSLFNKRRSAS